jgi:hypothetical protein
MPGTPDVQALALFRLDIHDIVANDGDGDGGLERRWRWEGWIDLPYDACPSPT